VPDGALQAFEHAACIDMRVSLTDERGVFLRLESALLTASESPPIKNTV
jgi:hypothetical protein